MALIGDKFDTHGYPSHSPHNGIVTQGSSLMRVEGRAVARVGDIIGGGGLFSQNRYWRCINEY